MKLASMLGTSAALGALLISAGNASAAEKTDPRQGKVTYQGSGSAERAPEYAEVWFSFQVGCRPSAEDVRAAIEKVSAPVWKAIAAKVSDRAATETSRTYWGNIENIQESPGSTLYSIPPARTPQGTVREGTVKRVETCTGKEIELTASVPSVYSGSQRFGVRTTDMDWAESIARTVRAQRQGQGKADVQYGVSALSYDVTLATKRAMFQETLNEAALEATGKGSKFESDSRSLKYASAHYLGHKASHPAVYQPAVGESLSRGKAPKVTLELPLVYTIYAEAKDLLDGSSKKTAGLESEYEVQGRAVVDADYALLNVSLVSQCQTERDAATKALEAPAKDVLGQFERYQGKRQASETDRLVNNEPSGVQAYYPYQPVEWDKNTAQPTKYINLCSNQIIAAPKSGNVQDLTAYYQAYQQLGVRSSDFVGILDLADGLQTKYARSTADAAATRLSVGKPIGQVTDETKRKLDISAREMATEYVLKKDGPLANDIVARKLVSAHLKRVREGVMEAAMPKMRSAAMMAPAAPAMESMADAPGGVAKSELQVDVVRKSNDQRPQFRMVRHFAFDYQFKTVDYAPLLNGQPTPAPAAPKAPAVTPEGPYLP